MGIDIIVKVLGGKKRLASSSEGLSQTEIKGITSIICLFRDCDIQTI